ncbi:MAG TPA: Sec-independent protein translocase protein TatB [Chloroflexia bacterium]|jgi:sec-independent protein translocase protein TatB|nr:Sec-independent protein translocase protein TatB [Chloroflexia bacterium]
MGFEVFGVGVPEMVIILVVALIFLGPEKLPEAARTVGGWVREIRGISSEAMSVWQETLQVGDTIKSSVSIDGAGRAAPRAATPPQLPVAYTPPDAAAEPATLDYPAPFAPPKTPSAPAEPLAYPAPFEK